jgi:hypothetical protein
MSDDDLDPRVAKSSGSAMRSMFAQDRAGSAARGPNAFKYEGKKKDEAAPVGAAVAPPAASGSPGVGGTQVACQAQAVAYRGDQGVGACFACVLISNGVPLVALVDREKRPLARVRVNVDLQLLQNQAELQYATLYDPAISQHWTLMFKGPAECTNFVCSALTVLHFVQASDGPAPNHQDLVESSARPAAKIGDLATISYTAWLVHRLGSSGFFTCGKLVDEVPLHAPRTVKLGTSEIFSGVEEYTVGMAAGAKRLMWLGPKKTRVAGLGNPEIAPNDSIVVLVTCVEVTKDGAGSGSMPSLAGDSGDDSDDIAFARRKKTASSSKTTREAQPEKEATVAPVSAVPTPAPTPAPTAAPAPAPGGLDQNTLLQTVLLHTLQLSQQNARPAPAPEPAAQPRTLDVERFVDRVHNQISSLYEKLDRLDIEGKLAKNNEVIERMVKKAVGKMPTNDVDIEDMAKDRDQLLAKIEHLQGRVEEMTDSYHKALETIGRHKDETNALKNDLLIERETAAQRVKELTERRRLELVDLEVRHRRDLDKTYSARYEEGKEDGYKSGFAAGKLHQLDESNSSSTEQYKQMLHQKDQRIVELESQVQQAQAKQYQERREYSDQIANLNHLIKRLEDRDQGKKQDVQDSSSQMCKTLRRAMNSTYAAIEAQFYATEREQISVEDALAMVLTSVKSETRTFIEEIKREAALIAAGAPRPSQAEDGDTTAPSNTQQHRDTVAAYLTKPSVPDPVLPSTEASTAVQDALAEIAEYQRQREREAIAETTRSVAAEEGTEAHYRRYTDDTSQRWDQAGGFGRVSDVLPPVPQSAFADERFPPPPPPPRVADAGDWVPPPPPPNPFASAERNADTDDWSDIPPPPAAFEDLATGDEQ